VTPRCVEFVAMTPMQDAFGIALFAGYVAMVCALAWQMSRADRRARRAMEAARRAEGEGA
jgi:cytochrome c-type biogenesis protein CcmH/NrfF